MGLDIYTGTLSRYYMRNWKTVTQQFCEENGMQYSQIHPTGYEEENGTAAETENIVKQWQEQLVNALKSSGAEGIFHRIIGKVCILYFMAGCKIC